MNTHRGLFSLVPATMATFTTATMKNHHFTAHPITLVHQDLQIPVTTAAYLDKSGANSVRLGDNCDEAMSRHAVNTVAFL